MLLPVVADVILTIPGFLIMLIIFLIGGVGSLLLYRQDAWANRWNSSSAIVGSLWGLLFSGLIFATNRTVTFTGGTSFFDLSFHIDTLAALFIFTISLIALCCSLYGLGYVKHFYTKYNIGVLGLLYSILICSLILIVTASNALFFLVAWEIMSISSYFLVVYDRRTIKNVKAGSLYLVMTFTATAFILLSFLLVYQYIGSFDFDSIRSSIALIPPAIKNLIFIFALIGFGTKAGIIPLHIWLPAAHAAAPSHVSAILSGVMIKTGIYMIIRMFLDVLQPAPLWWGLVIMSVGAISALLGVLYALTEHDLKRLLAYHSIENIGIILLGVGSAMTFFTLGNPTVAILGLTAACFHTLNHATFKSLLFLSAGSVINQTHTRNMESYGGLLKYMPVTGFCFLIGAMAISALPPFNGFFSEWLTFQSLFQGMSTLESSGKWIFGLAAGALALTGGLALACFVKAFGVTFLARPRSDKITRAHESSRWMQVGMGILAGCTLLFGLGSGYVANQLAGISHTLGLSSGLSSATGVAPLSTNGVLQVADHFASVSGPIIFITLVIAIGVTWVTTRLLINRGQRIVNGRTWDCGTDLTPRMEITSTGFARSIILIFKGVLKPSIQHKLEYDDAAIRYIPKTHAVVLGVTDVYQTYLYQPLYRLMQLLATYTKKIQSGNVNTYVLYLVLALAVALLTVLK